MERQNSKSVVVNKEDKASSSQGAEQSVVQALADFKFSPSKHHPRYDSPEFKPRPQARPSSAGSQRGSEGPSREVRANLLEYSAVNACQLCLDRFFCLALQASLQFPVDFSPLEKSQGFKRQAILLKTFLYTVYTEEHTLYGRSSFSAKRMSDPGSGSGSLPASPTSCATSGTMSHTIPKYAKV